MLYVNIFVAVVLAAASGYLIWSAYEDWERRVTQTEYEEVDSEGRTATERERARLGIDKFADVDINEAGPIGSMDPLEWSPAQRRAVDVLLLAREELKLILDMRESLRVVDRTLTEVDRDRIAELRQLINKLETQLRYDRNFRVFEYLSGPSRVMGRLVSIDGMVIEFRSYTGYDAVVPRAALSSADELYFTELLRLRRAYDTDDLENYR